MDNIEIERKWLLRGNFLEKFQEHLKHESSEEFVQCYLSSSERVRQIEEIKEDSTRSVARYEHFYKIRKEDGSFVERLTHLTANEWVEKMLLVDRGLNKIRETFRDPSTGLKYEVDQILYQNPYNPITLLEIEFQDFYPSLEAATKAFRLPNWLEDLVIAEVTDLKEFSNYHLSVKTNGV